MTRWSLNMFGAAFLCACAGLGGAAGAADEVRVYKTIFHSGQEVECPTPLLFDAGEPITIDITPEANCCGQENPCVGWLTMIRIVAQGGAPNRTLYDLGPVTITGSLSAGQEELLMLVAGYDNDTQSEVLHFPILSRDPIAPGAHNWAGVVAAEGLRNKVVLAASITGNLDGPSGSKISVGVVTRLQVVNELESSIAGNINIPVEAWGKNYWRADAASIGHITASNSITADILCRHHESGQTPANAPSSIRSIHVGPSLDAEGISGRIHAPYGSLHEVRSTGPVSIPSTPENPGILVGRDLELLYAGEPEDPQDPEPFPSVPVDIDTHIVVAPRPGDDWDLSRLQKLRTGGDLLKPIYALYIMPPSGETGGEIYGVLVGGDIKAPIDVGYNLNISVIRAANFAEGADVTIGNLMKGTIEAVTVVNDEPVYGRLRNVTVGRGSPPFGAETQGMNGSTPDENVRDPEAVIRGHQIDTVDIRRMFLNSKTTPPRIEADIIDLLVVDEMEFGTVTTPPGSSTPYASIGNIQIHNTYSMPAAGVLRPAEIYCRDFESFKITCSHGGILEVPELAPNQLISIHRGLFNGSEVLDSDCNIKPNAPGAPSSQSQIGIIRVRNSLSLGGQIILNGAGDADPNVLWHCTGSVKNLADDISLNAAPSTDDINTMPEYTRPSDTLGGGAVGLAPFYLYDEDCLPVNDDAAPTITIREFDRTNPLTTPRSVKLRFYGPVRVNHATESPVKLTLLRFANGHWHESSISPSRFTVNVKRTTDPGFSREVEIHGNGTWKFPAGWYKVEPVNTGAAALRSDLVDSQPLVRDFEYYFELMPETASTGYDLGGCGCPADFNQDGGVDGSDVEAFLIAWEIGESDGDVNCDGGVDGSDVETFFYYWEDGGCD